MIPKIAPMLFRLIVILILCECVAPVLAEGSSRMEKATVQQQHDKHAFFSFLYEPGEEERSEEEKVKHEFYELADFSYVSILLSAVHSPVNKDSSVLNPRSPGAPRYRLLCVLII